MSNELQSNANLILSWRSGLGGGNKELHWRTVEAPGTKFRKELQWRHWSSLPAALRRTDANLVGLRGSSGFATAAYLVTHNPPLAVYEESTS